MSVLPSEGVIMVIHFRLPSNPDFRLAPMPTDDPNRVSPRPCTNIVFYCFRSFALSTLSASWAACVFRDSKAAGMRLPAALRPPSVPHEDTACLGCRPIPPRTDRAFCQALMAPLGRVSGQWETATFIRPWTQQQITHDCTAVDKRGPVNRGTGALETLMRNDLIALVCLAFVKDSGGPY